MPWNEAPPTPEEMTPKRWDESPPSAEELSATDPSLWGKAKRAAGGLAMSAQEAIPFSGVIPKIGAASYAAQQEIGDLFRDEENQKPFAERYDEELARTKAENERILSQAPGWSKAVGTAAGLVPAMAMPIPGAGFKGATGVAARIAGAGGMSAAESATRDQGAQGAAEHGLLASGIQAGVEALTPAARAASPLIKKGAEGYEKIKDYFRSAQGTRGAKTVGGQNIKFYRDLAGRGGVDAIAEKGRIMTEADEAGPPVVGWFTKTGGEKATKRAAEKAEFYGEKIGEIGARIDEFAPNSVRGSDIAANIRRWAKENLTDAPHDARRTAELEELASFYESKGNMSFKDAQNYKNSYKPAKYGQPATSWVETADVSGALKEAVGEAMDKAADTLSKQKFVAKGDQVSETENKLNGILQEYQDAKKRYGAYRPSQKAAEAAELREISNRKASPSDTAVALTAFLKSSKDPTGAALVAAAAGAANNQVRTRGSAFVSRSAKVASDLMEKAPESLGPHAKSLKAAAERGNAAFMATHAILLDRDPEYAKQVSKGEE